MREIAAMLKAIHASEDRAAADDKAVQVIEKLRGLRLTRAADLVAASVHETLAYYVFPEEHWRGVPPKKWSENWDMNIPISGGPEHGWQTR